MNDARDSRGEEQTPVGWNQRSAGPPQRFSGGSDIAPYGRKYWRCLEDIGGPALAAQAGPTLQGAGPTIHNAHLLPDGVSRRQFLALMGASMALAGIGGCSIKPAPQDEIVPYVNQPGEIVPGRPLFYATTMTMAGSGVGLLVESHEGRPTKIEGNPDHPASRGATDIFHQASVLTLYDPDRAQTVTHLGQTRTWSDVLTALRPVMQKLREKRGDGLRLLTETIVSPTLARQLENLLKDLPQAKWHVWEPIHRDEARQGTQLAFGEAVDAVYDFSKADVVLSLDADFLQCGPGNLRYAADFMARRRVRTSEKDAAHATMNRLYVVETSVSCTGAKADHRLALRPREIERLASDIAIRLRVAERGQIDEGLVDLEHEKWVSAVAKDLQSHRGRCLVVAGDQQPAAVHLLAHAINDRLGNVGQTIKYMASIDAKPVSRAESLKELASDMDAGRVEMLLILGGNPVYTAPADLDFAKHLKKVPHRIHHSLFLDETSYHCQWHLPEAHFLEAWSDARAFDGTASIVQPLVEPLYQGRSAHELIAMLADLREASGREIVQARWRDHWKAHHKDGHFEQSWEKSLHDGVIAGTAFEPKAVSLRPLGERKSVRAVSESNGPHPNPLPKGEGTVLDIAFQPDPTLYDGSWANNGWLQELPKPLTKLAWGNAAIVSPATAKELGVKIGSYAHGGEHGGYYMPVVELTLDDRSVRAPVWIVPGHADGAITVWFGHGRTRAGRVGGKGKQTVGFNAYLLRTAAQPWSAAGVQVAMTGDTELVACTQAHQSMEGREPVRAGTLSRYQQDANFVAEQEEAAAKEVERRLSARGEKHRREIANLYHPFDYGPPKHRWGMAIDLTACVGCHACVVACQAENNIPVVGKDQVARGREMHWLRVDRYIDGPAENPEGFHFQPVPCMHCENAPCEYVCPVKATVHSADGLNDMAYNRCVGTRFCSNNCPYKVRRFNFHLYSDFETASRRLQYNPEVTVRSRGVMEKCTYCVQRIRRAEIDGETQDRRLVDGEVLTACQAACPTGAIVFGDINDPKSDVKRCKDSPLHYGLLADLNTHPRTTYLASLRNPNPELETQGGTSLSGHHAQHGREGRDSPGHHALRSSGSATQEPSANLPPDLES